jgi:protein-S-isoprenylcysteine O-methyltransferase Ste14
MLQTIIFAVLSIPIVLYSWPSLRDRRTHGFYRFFAFECILGLIVLNAPAWFAEPFVPRQIVSWLLLLASLGLVIHGFCLLRQIGRPQGSFENTTTLVETGAYRYIRHPLYSSLLGLAWGAFLKWPSLFGVALVLAATAALIATAKVEEGENLVKFGPAYHDYMQRTKMFVPFLL